MFPDQEIINSELVGFPEVWFDHLAYCVADPRDAFNLLRSSLGMQWELWEINSDFGGVQVKFSNGLKLELIHPNSHDGNHFTNRFISKNICGPHHLTFRVKDIQKFLAKAEELTIPIIQASLDNELWREFFIHPKEAEGLLIQVAECPVLKASTPPTEWSELSAVAPCNFLRIEHFFHNSENIERIFCRLLGGTREELSGVSKSSTQFNVRFNEDRIIRFINADEGQQPGHHSLVIGESVSADIASAFVSTLGGKLVVEPSGGYTL